MKCSETGDSRFLSVEDLAKRYVVPRATIHAWIYQKKAPRSYKIGRYRRFRLSDVLEWESEQADDYTTENV